MSVVTKDKVETKPEQAPQKRRFGLTEWFITVLVVVAIVAAGVFAAMQEDEEPAAPAAGILPTEESLFTADEIALMQLANRGYIPRSAVDWDLMELKRLATNGLIPAEALQPGPGEAPTIFTDEELAMMDLANRGLVPSAAVDWDTIELKRLIAWGLVPPEAAP